MRRAAALLALLLLAPPGLALLLLAPPGLAQEPQRPSLGVVRQPDYAVGDFWAYAITDFGANNTTVTQNQTLRVAELGTWEGTPAVRIAAEASNRFEGEQGAFVRSTDNKTTWYGQDGLQVLRIEDVSELYQHTRLFDVLTHTEVNWTFHEPMDLYQFPILRGDAWPVLTNATIWRNTSFVTTTFGPNGTSVRSNQTPVESNLTQTSGTQWLRQDVCGRGCNAAGEFDVVVLVSTSGNATLYDFWAPAAGNLVRREILNETGAVREITALTAYRFQNAPGPPPPEPQGSAVPLELLAAAGVGVLLGLGVVMLWRRRERARREAPPSSPAEPPAQGPPPPGPGGAAGGAAEGPAAEPGEGAGEGPGEG
jgi:hypothetical protein